MVSDKQRLSVVFPREETVRGFFFFLMFFFFFLCTEVLPLVQFYLEEGISDEEAVSLIDLEVPHMDEKNAHLQHTDNGGIL